MAAQVGMGQWSGKKGTDLRYILELESRGLAVAGGKEEGGSRMILMLLAWVDAGTIYEMGRNMGKEPRIQWWTCGQVRLEMETAQQMWTAPCLARVSAVAVMLVFVCLFLLLLHSLPPQWGYQGQRETSELWCSFYKG